jgi:hypothetical protein
MKVCVGGVIIKVTDFQLWALDLGERSASHVGHSSPGKELPWLRLGWLQTRFGTGGERRKLSASAGNQIKADQMLQSHSIDWATNKSVKQFELYTRLDLEEYRSDVMMVLWSGGLQVWTCNGDMEAGTTDVSSTASMIVHDFKKWR